MFYVLCQNANVLHKTFGKWKNDIKFSLLQCNYLPSDNGNAAVPEDDDAQKLDEEKQEEGDQESNNDDGK